MTQRLWLRESFKTLACDHGGIHCSLANFGVGSNISTAGNGSPSEELRGTSRVIQ
jgi:hypothetical protein